ncbi:MAG: MFS transporter, partial [Pseudomonas sp.]
PIGTSFILVTAGLRAGIISLSAIVLGLRLVQVGASPAQIGVTVAAGMAANALSAGWVAWRGDHAARPPVLIALAVASGFGLMLLAITREPLLIWAAAFIGMVNGTGRDRGGAQAIEQAILAAATPNERRTSAFVRYAVAQDAGGALGALAAAITPWLQQQLDMPAPPYGVLLGAGGAILLMSALLYARLPHAAARTEALPRVSPESRRRIAGLSGLFALDSLGGGFLAGTLLTYWFFERFALTASTIGAIFFAARVLNAASYFLAEALARRIGLVRTMVYTHLPTSVMLFVLPWMPTASWAVALFLLRESLVQMDVPARQSYVTAVVAPHERASALGVTNLVRYAGWAVGPALAGLSMGWAGVSAPLWIGAVLKAAYDLALLASYRAVRPPEE